MAPTTRFNQRLQNLAPSILSDIGKIDELKGMWIAGAQLSPVVLGRLKQSVLITSTGASTRIEGAKLSDEDVEKLMRGISVEKFTDRDKQEIKRYFELLQNVFNSWKNLSFNEGTIKHFHKQLLKYVEKDKLHRGEYKKSENKVHMINSAGESVGILFDTTPAYLTPTSMLALVEWTQKELKEKTYHPLLIIGSFLVEFLQIHPFTDGNGRLSRIITNLLLLKSGYLYVPYVSHEKLVEDNKPNYYLALRTSQKTFGTEQENINPWFEFFLKIILKQSEMAVDLLSAENVEKTFSKNQLAAWQCLQKVEEATPREIAKNAGIARPTINQIMTKFIKLKQVERLGLGRSSRYRITKIQLVMSPKN
ncbi:MAG: Filamentation induced by cAMP protein Fic [Berkelbacteria bacterium GW2011_GWA1_36_9]|uniref:Filamentation induced by cAMP protein Fic n=1 Tax=Berkelbacteria bacterium GW2011_GWA1_36_9 TaxID=1618331 RepID=A0A0G0I280_9BACT|nr:MAG: Filamentation induced by cAMP protein Fic [Berkelbacteria bacterium GW2011_GWA1_36_9]